MTEKELKALWGYIDRADRETLRLLSKDLLRRFVRLMRGFEALEYLLECWLETFDVMDQHGQLGEANEAKGNQPSGLEAEMESKPNVQIATGGEQEC